MGACLLHGREILPDDLLKGLGSEEFDRRETAQAELLAWAMNRPQVATPELVRIFQKDEDPEVRKRALAILKVLGDADYLSDGQGYLGILMQEEPLEAEQGGKVQAGIRVLDVMPGSPAEKADLKRGDLIISLDGKRWEGIGAVTVFSETIAAKKPLVEVILMVKRVEPAPIEITVKLGKRPIPDLRAAGGDLPLLEEQAKELHFKEWLGKQQAD